MPDRELTSELAEPGEVAQFLHQTEAALAQDRYRGTGPKFIKHGRRVLYRWVDVYAYLDANTVERTGENERAATT